MLGGISVGIIFAIEGLYSQVLNIPIVSHLTWVVPALAMAFWLRSSQEQFIVYYRPAVFLLGVLSLISALSAIALTDVETFTIIKKGTLLVI